jgi:hypothetical protein
MFGFEGGYGPQRDILHAVNETLRPFLEEQARIEELWKEGKPSAKEGGEEEEDKEKEKDERTFDIWEVKKPVFGRKYF